MLTDPDALPSNRLVLNPVQIALAAAAAELRIARRTVRTWVFAALAIAVGLVVYHTWSIQHTQMGIATHPRFALPGFGILVLWFLVAGNVFLAFDIPGRDARERVAAVLDSRPPSNIALLAGRLLAVALAAWLPLLVLAVLLQAGGFVIDHLDARAGVSAEPVSLATFMFIDVPVTLLFWGALVVLLAATLRNRLVVAVVALGLLATHAWAVLNTPLHLLPIVSGVANLGLPGSEILPRTVSGTDLFQRLSVLVLAAGLVASAAATLPRRDATSRTPGLAVGLALLVLGAVGIGGLVWFVEAERSERVAWADAHESALEAPRLDVERLSGTIDVDPEHQLEIDVVLDLRTPETAFDELRFSLNPAMTVESVRLDGNEMSFHHELGVLAVTPPGSLASGAPAQLSIRASGVPDPRFAYLDSSVWALDETLLGMPIALGGDVASIFDPNFVALTPAVAWLPMSGANFAIDDPSRRAPDFHDIDLLVRIPDGWHAAGPGRLAAADDGVRFRPSVPLAQFPLIAAPFERLTLTRGDIEYELLIHPGHLAGVEYFSEEERREPTLQYLEQRLQFQSESLLPYPHAVFSVVEVPGQLRRYGGGRIMDTVQALPGVQMLPEHGFPTRRFAAESPFQRSPDEMWLQQQLYSIESGPHRVPAIAGRSRNMGPYRASASGHGAIAANYLFESLISFVGYERRTVAPAHWLQIGLAPGLTVSDRVLNRLMGTATFSFGWYQFFGMSLENRSAEFSFTGVDATATTEGVDILIHKGNLISLSVLGLMERTKVAEFVALMHERHGGATFTVDEFVAAMSETDPAMASYIGHFMREDSLPGFLVSDVRAFRLPDDDNGTPRYQVAVHVRNDEPAPGVVYMIVREAETDGFGLFHHSPFVHVPGNSSRELGVLTNATPTDLRLETFLSQNARVTRLPLPRVDAETIVPEAPFYGPRPSTWLPPDLGIVVDDLDSGYSYVSPPRRGFRLAVGPEDTDAEMPEYNYLVPAPGWHRHGDPQTISWGRYRRTLTRIVAGTGEGRAMFAAELPVPGRWRLYYHLPGASASGRGALRAGGWSPGDDFGTYNLEIQAGDVRIPVAYDARMAVAGWNDIGTFELAAGPVSVAVTDATDGEVVVADAVRWQIVDGPDR